MNTQSVHAVPEDVLPYVGEIMDLDGHEHTPPNLMVETFGGVAQRLVDALLASNFPSGKEFRLKDDAELNPDTLWEVKYTEAPGAMDMRRRLQVLDLMGVRRQMIFPGGLGIQALVIYLTADNPEALYKSISQDRAAYARRLIDAFNDWCGRVVQISPQLRPTAILVGESPDELVAEAKRWLTKGVRCFWTPNSVLPGDRSPAHSDLDPLYDVFEVADATLCFHAGANFGFLRTERWRDAPSLSGFKIGGELSLDPWTLSTVSKPSENFLATMVLGGVFERHPRLRCAFCEVAADWIGPLAYSLDMWVESGACVRSGAKWQMRRKPSEYIRSNVRVSPFYFEDVGAYIARYGLEEVYCYASDFPHIEGGKDPMQRFSASLKAAGFGESVARKFFVENAMWALPD